MAQSTSPPSRDTPTTSFSAAPPPQQTPQLPPPASFDVLPPVNSILQRLQASQNAQAAGEPAPENAISPKDVVALVDVIKQKLREARAQVAKLPDMHMTLDDQGEEIEELQEKIGKQKKELMRLKQIGIDARAKDDNAMDET